MESWIAPDAPRGVRVLVGALVAIVALCFAWWVCGIGDSVFQGRLAGAINVGGLGLAAAVASSRAALRAEERLAWSLMSTGLWLWTIGAGVWWVFLSGDQDPPFPSAADAFWLAFYLPIYASILLLARRRGGAVDRRAWIDGLIAALAVSAITVTLALDVVAEALGGDPMATAVNLAYPIADTLLLAMVVAVVVSLGRPDRTWTLVGLGLLVFAVTDSVYMVQIAEGTYVFGEPLELGWSGGVALIGLAAWQRPRAVQRVQRDHGVLVPTGLALVSLALLVYDHFERAPLYALVLATGSLGLALVRLVISHNDSRRSLRLSRHQALTDSLTGMGNRLALIRGLEAACESPREELLLLFDLDGFKHYNDSYGHPAGDALLRRLGQRLTLHVAARGSTYRMGGDEFCALVPAPDTELELRRLIASASRALTEEGDGFRVGASCGHVLISSEATDPAEALRVADRRLYAAKNSGRMSARVQSMRVLAGAMREWDADLGDHGRDVGDLAARVARTLGLDGDEVERIVVAAELHDVGKIAIPRSILQKPGKLDDEEWAFIRRHTLIGERIVQGAPALASVGPVIRSSHERWDGSGYPDGLAGDDIPLGAQIVFVCDALAAMTTDRTYHRAISEGEAVAELRRCAGTQFSPRVVEAACAALAPRRPVALSAAA